MPNPYLMLVVLGAIWATRLGALKYAINAGLPAPVTIQVAVLGIAIGLTLVNALRGTWPPLRRDTVRFYLLSGLLGFICPFGLEAIVAARLPVFVLILIVTTAPVWTMLVAAAVGTERISAVRATGVVLGFAAAGLVAFDSSGGEGPGAVDPLWCLLAMAIPLFYAVYTVFVASRFPRRLDAVQVAQGQAIIVALAVLAAQPFQDFWSRMAFSPVQVTAVGWVVAAEVVGLMMYLSLARDRGATFVTQANYVAICMGAVLGAFVFGDPIGWLSLLGAVLVAVALRLARAPVPAAVPTASSG
ncbi:MAG: DMT family transporter [Alphaproteobacteria bacterium]